LPNDFDLELRLLGIEDLFGKAVSDPAAAEVEVEVMDERLVIDERCMFRAIPLAEAGFSSSS
jgi:hypothetical protein